MKYVWQVFGLVAFLLFFTLGFVQLLDQHNAAKAGYDFAVAVVWLVLVINELWSEHKTTTVNINVPVREVSITEEGE